MTTTPDVFALSTKDLYTSFLLLTNSTSLDVLVDQMGKTPTAQCYALCAALVLLCFVVSLVTDNYSQVDKLWSLTPWMYVWIYVVNSQGDPRLVLMAVVTTVWGIRLTLNFNRRGGYAWPPWLGDEDYRWTHVKELWWMDAKNNPIRWQLFNFGFVCVFQHVVLLWIALPAQVVYVSNLSKVAPPLGVADLVTTAVILGLVAFEGVADNQQFDFQTVKYEQLGVVGDVKKIDPPYSFGFPTEGLWAMSRHPNYFAEQAIWIVFNAYSFIAARRVGFNWPIVGCLVLVFIFSQSLPLAETITSKKYPLYKKYQKQVPALFPYGSGVDFSRKD